jgi:hypothetical protein
VLALAHLYVVVILPVAILWGFWMAVVAAVASAPTFDFLFVPPLYFSTIMAPSSAATLAIYCLTAHVASELANRVRKRTGKRSRWPGTSGRRRSKSGGSRDEQAALRRVATLVAAGAAPSETFGVVGAEPAVRTRRCGGVPLRAGSQRHGPRSVECAERGVPGRSRLAVAGVGAAVTVLETGRPTRTERIAGPPGSIAGCFAQIGARSTVGAPITVEGRLWGDVIDAATRRGRLSVGSEAMPVAARRSRPHRTQFGDGCTGRAVG